MPTYIALLRGINSGKNPSTKMEVLQKAFEHMGFKNVRTVIASGNVIFETGTSDPATLEKKIEKTLPSIIGFESRTIVRTAEEIRRLIKKNPFKKINATAQIRLYVTFVKDARDTSLHYPVKGKGYTLLGIVDETVCSVVDLTVTKTPDLMKVLDKAWAHNTTRGWATIEKIAKASI